MSKVEWSPTWRQFWAGVYWGMRLSVHGCLSVYGPAVQSREEYREVICEHSIWPWVKTGRNT